MLFIDNVHYLGIGTNTYRWMKTMGIGDKYRFYLDIIAILTHAYLMIIDHDLTHEFDPSWEICCIYGEIYVTLGGGGRNF